MKKYFDTVITSTGQPAIGVSVQVNNYPSLTAATIYSDNGVTPKTNPITTDATGYFEFYVADGRYQITISGTGIVTRQINDVVIEDYADMTGPLTIADNSTSPALKITQTGTGNALVVEDAASDTTPFVINSSGQVYVGNTSSITYQSMGLSYGIGALQVTGADGNSSSQLIAQFNTGSSVAIPTLVLAKSKNATVGAHTTVAVSDSIGAISFDGSDGTNFIEAARILAQVDGTPGLNDMPGRLVFATTADGASAPTERMRIDSAGNIILSNAASAPVRLYTGGGARGSVQISDPSNVSSGAIRTVSYGNNLYLNSASTWVQDVATIGGSAIGLSSPNGAAGEIIFMSAQDQDIAVSIVERLRIDSSGNVLVKSAAGLGYGTGAGGTVNQTGARTTGVTLSKPTGSITLVSAAGSTSWQSFTVTNTAVTADDVISVCQKSGTDKYMIHVTNVASGSFQITFATTGGTTTEQPVFSFAVIKGAIA